MAGKHGGARKRQDIGDVLVGYREVISVIEALPVLVREKRRRLGLSQRDVAKASGAPLNTISRFERGQQASSANLVRLLRWVGTPDEVRAVTPAPETGGPA